MDEPLAQPDLPAALRDWLTANLDEADVQRCVPEGDPLRVWWTPEPGDARLGLLLDVVLGGEDHLTLLALVQCARAKPGTAPLAPELEWWLAERLTRLAAEARAGASGAEYDAFVSYSHRDMARAELVLAMLADAGLRVFQDVRDIRPGESIVGRLYDVMSRVPRAVLLVSANYVDSEWAGRELRALLARRDAGGLMLLPVLLDDIPLPPEIADVFTIDLRGFAVAADRDWAAPRLARLVTACRRRRDDAEEKTLLQP
jgi:hypothetical protein